MEHEQPRQITIEEEIDITGFGTTSEDEACNDQAGGTGETDCFVDDWRARRR